MTVPMRQKKRQVTDEALIAAMLDRMEIMFLGINDGAAPYVVPLNFGWSHEEGSWSFYFHCARRGSKLDLLRRDPRVCATMASFVSYAGAPVKGHLHDYRSVIARGTASRIDDAGERLRAMELLLKHNRRDPSGAQSPVMDYVEMWKIVCAEEDVTAKAELTPSCMDEVDFLPPDGDGLPVDDSHILEMHERR